MDRCPNCRARVSGADHCRRCGMALELLGEVEATAECQLAKALQHLINCDSTAASTALRRLQSLRYDPLAEQLLAFAEALRKQPMPGLEDPQQEPIDRTKGTLPNAFYLSD